MSERRATVTISNHPNPDLNGEVVVHMPSIYETVRIEARMAALAAPLRFEELPPDGRALTRMLATLEFVIDRAPKGFYRDTDQGPSLEPGRLADADNALLWEVYRAYVEARNTFRGEREGVAFGAGEAPERAGDVPGGEAAAPRPAAEPGGR